MDMFRYAAFCTAMENGIPELKDMADYMTTNVENNGIAKAFRDLGLIWNTDIPVSQLAIYSIFMYNPIFDSWKVKKRLQAP